VSIPGVADEPHWCDETIDRSCDRLRARGAGQIVALLKACRDGRLAVTAAESAIQWRLRGHSGVELETLEGWATWVRDGKITRIEQHADKQEALDAAGTWDRAGPALSQPLTALARRPSFYLCATDPKRRLCSTASLLR
jgi:hypothetical protein